MSTSLWRSDSWQGVSPLTSGQAMTGTEVVSRYTTPVPVLACLPDVHSVSFPVTESRHSGSYNLSQQLGVQAPCRFAGKPTDDRRSRQRVPNSPLRELLTFLWQLLIGPALIAAFVLAYVIIAGRGVSTQPIDPVSPHGVGVDASQTNVKPSPPSVMSETQPRIMSQPSIQQSPPPSDVTDNGWRYDGHAPPPRDQWSLARDEPAAPGRQPRHETMRNRSACTAPTDLSLGEKSSSVVQPQGPALGKQHYQYPHTDPLTYLYPNGDAAEGPKSEEIDPISRESESPTWEYSKPGMATLKGIIAPPPYKDRSRR